MGESKIDKEFVEMMNAYSPVQPFNNKTIHTLVVKELRSAEYKHSWEGNSIVKNALILAEEAGEVARAVLQYDEEGGSIEAVRNELIQTAAMCYRMLKNLPL